MRGIAGYGVYLPHYRLDRSRIRQTLGQGGGKGTRAVASYDEDTTSMAVEAARSCLRNSSVKPSSLLFSTTNPAYLDKTNANTIHAALDLDENTFAADLGGAPRSAIAAARAAFRMPGTNLVIASDLRVGMPSGKDESDGGDGAVALLLADNESQPVIAEFVASGTSTGEFLDRWRVPGDPTSKVWEERFGEGIYLEHVKNALDQALSAADLSVDELSKVIINGLHGRACRGASKMIGAKPDAFVDDLTSKIGNTGSAHAYLLLASVLDQAEPNEVIAIVNLADGCDVTILRTTDAISEYQPEKTVAQVVSEGNDSLDYSLYLSWRGFLDREPPRRPDPIRPAAPPSGRAEDWKYAFVGSKDRESGAIHLPPQRTSMKGGNVDDMERIRMADTPATIATFTIDRLAYSLSPPMVVAVIDFDGGGRFRCEMTDVDPENVHIGDRVAMTFRRLFTADGVHNYFWKARPIAG
ncbi:OB-fold domain-containing protein [Myxococcota bacterium]|nr:OB-fold domain-containing protein [Myxococcota bacterium]